MKQFREIFRFCTKIILILLLLTLIACAGMVGWLSSGAREIAALNPVISHHIAKRIGASDVQMQSPTLFINLQSHDIELELRKIEATLPSLKAQIKTAKVAVGLGSLAKLQPAYNDLVIRHFNLKMNNATDDLHINELHLKPNAQNNNQNHLEVSITANEKPSGKIIADITFNPKTIVANADVQSVPAALLQIALPEIGEINADMNVTIEAVFKRNLQLIFTRAKLDIAKLRLQHKEFYPDAKHPLELQNITADMEWERKKHFLNINSLKAQSGELRLEMHGKLLPDFSHANISGNLEAMGVRKLVQIWPKQVANEARAWVDAHLLAGAINSATIDIVHNKTTKANVVLQVTGAEIEYAKHLPRAYDANGEVKITENSMAIKIDSAKTLQSINVRSGYAEIPSFTEAAVPMRFNLPIIADAKDVAIFLSAKHLNKAGELRLKPNEIKGNVNGVLTLDFPLYPERAGLGKSSFDNLLFTIKAKIEGLTQADLFGVWDLQGFNGRLMMDNDAVTADAMGELNHAPIKLKLKHVFAKRATSYDFNLRLNDAQFADFEIDLPANMVQGFVAINGKMQQVGANKQTGLIKQIEATIDLSDASIDLSAYGWRKKQGKPATLNVVEHYDGEVKTIDSLHLQAGDDEIKGSMKMQSNGEIASIDMPLVSTSHADLSMKYVANLRPELTLKGQKLDIAWLQPEEQENSKPKPKQNPLKHLMNKRIDIELKQVITREKTLHNFSLKTDCMTDYCASANVSANYDKPNNSKRGKIEASIALKPDGKRHFSLQCDNFGSIMKAASGNNHFRGGSLKVAGVFADAKPDKPLQGRMILQDVKVVGAPILTRLLTLASLTGIADALMGAGISFDKISANLDYNDERIMFAKGAAKGDALGIMFEGMLQPFGEQRQKLKGTVIPSYALNSLPSKVPLLGLLVGEEGEGVFATRFSVDGTLSNPDVMVNPLSMITPGFLRNIFEIFPDSSPDDNDNGDTKKIN